MVADKRFGRLLRQLRTERKLTLERLAQAVTRSDGRPITPAYLSLIETGRKPPPRQAVLAGLARALAVPLEQLEWAAKGKHFDLISEGKSGRILVEVKLHSNVKKKQLEAGIEQLKAYARRLGSEELIIRVGADGTVTLSSLKELR